MISSIFRLFGLTLRSAEKTFKPENSKVKSQSVLFFFLIECLSKHGLDHISVFMWFHKRHLKVGLNYLPFTVKEITGDDEEEGTSCPPPAKRLKVEPEKKKEKRHKVDEDEIQKMQ